MDPVDPVDLEARGPWELVGPWARGPWGPVVGVAFPPHLSMIGYRGAQTAILAGQPPGSAIIRSGSR